MVAIMNVLYMFVGMIFFALFTAFQYERRGWLENLSETNLIIHGVIVAVMLFLSSFVPYYLRPLILICYLIGAIILAQYPTMRKVIPSKDTSSQSDEDKAK
jgi:hypothetical protein